MAMPCRGRRSPRRVLFVGPWNMSAQRQVTGGKAAGGDAAGHLVAGSNSFGAVALAPIVDDNPKSPRIIDFLQRHPLTRHLAVDAVEALQPPLSPMEYSPSSVDRR